ncbi:MAG: 50S ribosomal protein L10 [Candidatus Omnitrophota bacterium]|jgi:large subunit ribosomal protein L10
MKRIGSIFREVSQNRIKGYLKESASVLVIKYSGLSSPDLTALRASLKNSQAQLFVVKNTVARHALKDSGLETLVQSIEGPCGLIFVKEEPVEASRALFNFRKEHEQLKLEGGFLKDKILKTEDIEALAKLPSKEILRAQVVMTLNSPISKLVRVLNNTLTKFVICLDKIKEKKAT